LVRAVRAILTEVAAGPADRHLPVGAGVGGAALLVRAVEAVGLAVALVLLRNGAVAVGTLDEAGAVLLVGGVLTVGEAVAATALQIGAAAVGAVELDAVDLVGGVLAVVEAVAHPAIGDHLAVATDEVLAPLFPLDV